MEVEKRCPVVLGKRGATGVRQGSNCLRLKLSLVGGLIDPPDDKCNSWHSVSTQGISRETILAFRMNGKNISCSNCFAAKYEVVTSF